MANIKSAKKRILVTETKTARNKAIKSKVKRVFTEILLVFGTDFFCLMIFSYNLE